MQFKVQTTKHGVHGEREPITAVCGRAPSGHQGQSPGSGPFIFSTSNESGKIYPSDCDWQTECSWCHYHIEQDSKYFPPGD